MKERIEQYIRLHPGKTIHEIYEPFAVVVKPSVFSDIVGDLVAEGKVIADRTNPVEFVYSPAR